MNFGAFAILTSMNMITPFHNYDNGYIGLANLPLPELPKTLSVSGYDLVVKSEFHISLLCTKNIAKLIDSAGDIEAELVQAFKEFITTSPLTCYTLTGKYELVKRDDRVTVVALANVPGVDQLFAGLSTRYGVTLPVQPTHITLYTLQPEMGIGILSPEELARDGQPVTPALPL
jgi:hypothetical protein